jgi:hypothetical protein
MGKCFTVIVAAAAAALSFSGASHAAEYPTRPVRIVMGFPAGGPTDAAGRIIAQVLQQSLGQPVNRSFAGFLRADEPLEAQQTTPCSRAWKATRPSRCRSLPIEESRTPLV